MMPLPKPADIGPVVVEKTGPNLDEHNTPEATPGDALEEAIASVFADLQELVVRRAKALPPEAQITERRAMVCAFRALGRCYTGIIKTSKISGKHRARMESVVRLAVKMIPRALR